MSKITAFVSGSCYDCGTTYLILPDGIDLKALRAEHDKWYREVWVPALRDHRRAGGRGNMAVQYVEFFERVKAAGAREPTEDELEVRDEDY